MWKLCYESSSDEEVVDDTEPNYDSEASGMSHKEAAQAEFFNSITQSQTAWNWDNAVELIILSSSIARMDVLLIAVSTFQRFQSVTNKG